MISFSPEHLAEANREAERKIHRAIAGSGTVRLTLWQRLVQWWGEPISTIRKLLRDSAISLAAGLIVGVGLAWVLT